jgi:hypothetical protein
MHDSLTNVYISILVRRYKQTLVLVLLEAPQTLCILWEGISREKGVQGIHVNGFNPHVATILAVGFWLPRPRHLTIQSEAFEISIGVNGWETIPPHQLTGPHVIEEPNWGENYGDEAGDCDEYLEVWHFQ